jgi:hypothetical protein
MKVSVAGPNYRVSIIIIIIIIIISPNHTYLPQTILINEYDVLYLNRGIRTEKEINYNKPNTSLIMEQGEPLA